ncbi:hypothetical protein L916_21612 [Phytophthora nicotianae]|uniref:Uncharacterized protein n=1 Tax=Phytophthora nicotianae TaxID=4792 RepID=W2HT97_PHYNI|nr:hypothetical protein L916_21612 [Phytophthora nicotianae]
MKRAKPTIVFSGPQDDVARPVVGAFGANEPGVTPCGRVDLVQDTRK